PALNGSPHETTARRLKRLRQVEPVGLNLVCRDPKLSVRTGTVGRGMELLFLEIDDRRHEAVDCDPARPLPDVGEVAGVERKRAASGLPHTMSVAKIRERAIVPVFDDADPAVTEGLSVERLKIRVERDRECAGWRLAL